MRIMDDGKMERMIAETRAQKERMEELMRDVEQKKRFENEDLRYIESTLRAIENNLKRLRKRVKESEIRYL